MMKKMLILCISVFLTNSVIAQTKTDHKLKAKIQKLIENFQGEIGIYVCDLKSRKEVAICADSIFPTASVIKIPILVGIFDQINKGNLQLNQHYTYRESQKYGGSGLMQFFKDSTTVDLKTLVALMISYSDNVTSIWCQSLAGGGTHINQLMEDLALKNTKVNSRTEGRNEQWKTYGWGQTTPREMALLLEKIRKGEVISSEMSEQMYRFLGNIFYDGRALSQIPAHIKSASKTGSLDDVRNEVVLVNAPKREYVFSIFTKNNTDKSWNDTNQAEELTRKLSKLLWEYYQ